MDKLLEKFTLKFPHTKEGTFLLIGFLLGIFVSFTTLYDWNSLPWYIEIVGLVLFQGYIFMLFITQSDKPNLDRYNK